MFGKDRSFVNRKDLSATDLLLYDNLMTFKADSTSPQLASHLCSRWAGERRGSEDVLVVKDSPVVRPSRDEPRTELRYSVSKAVGASALSGCSIRMRDRAIVCRCGL